jgi:hypothetical protein
MTTMQTMSKTNPILAEATPVAEAVTCHRFDLWRRQANDEALAGWCVR